MKEINVIIEKLKESLVTVEGKIDNALKDIDTYQKEIDAYNKKIDELKETIEIEKTNKVSFEAKIQEAEAFAKSVEEVVPLMTEAPVNVEKEEVKKDPFADMVIDGDKEEKDEFAFNGGFDALNRVEEKDEENNTELPFLNPNGAPIFDENGFDISNQANQTIGLNEMYNYQPEENTMTR